MQTAGIRFAAAINSAARRRQRSRLAYAAAACLGLQAIATAAQTNATDTIDWERERQFWSFQPPKAQPRPAVAATDWASQPLDYFVLARLERDGFTPAAPADRSSLMRRVTFDLTGLPPTPGEIAAFVADSREDAYQRVVERLLASPRFGERMASLWLPLARYAEDQAHQVGDDTQYFYPNAWRYREWVIRAFNRDLPYDQFVRLQLAADRIPGTAADDLVALGFLGLGPKYYNRNRLEVQADEWEDRVDVVSRALLGLTVACARCHDHKYEPITMRDYYALAGVFASTKMVNFVPGAQSNTNAPEAGAAEKKKKTTLPPEALHIVADDDKPQNLAVFLRGNVERKGPVVERRFLQVLSDATPKPFADGSGRMDLAEAIASPENPLTARVFVNRVWGQFFGKPLVETPSNFGHSGLAPTHPELLDDLAARFMRNGWLIKALVREIVLSSSYRRSSRVGTDLANTSHASRADRSSRRERAHTLREGDFQSRRTSAATGEDREVHQGQESEAGLDHTSRSVAFTSRRRLSIEQWRDATLFVSGELETGGVTSLELDDPRNRRRTVYARVSRLKLNDLLMQFDYPDANVHAEKRSQTTTAMQRLFVLNSPFVLERAKALAARLLRSADLDGARVTQAHVLLFGREPTRQEIELAIEFLRLPPAQGMSRWEQYAHVLLASSEMLYVD